MVVWGLLGQTNVEITKEADWEKLLQQEEASCTRCPAAARSPLSFRPSSFRCRKK